MRVYFSVLDKAIVTDDGIQLVTISHELPSQTIMLTVRHMTCMVQWMVHASVFIYNSLLCTH